MLGTLALLALGTAACDVEPPPPPPVFVVDDPADWPDLNPGDGVCENIPERADCTLRAAIEEGNALGGAEIHIQRLQWTDDPITLEAPVEVTGDIRIVATGPGLRIASGPGMVDTPIHVVSGGSLVVEGLDLFLVPLRVDGRAGLLRTRSITFGDAAGDGFTGGAVEVAPGGVALVQGSWLASIHGDPVRNAGTFMVDHATVGAYWDGALPEGWQLGGIRTAPGGTTLLRATWLASGTCTGTAPVSLGYNAAVGTTCGLTGPTDGQDAPELHNGQVEAPTGWLVDAVPLGEAGCGTIATDIDGADRALDGDGDGTVACDIGAVELAPPPPA